MINPISPNFWPLLFQMHPELIPKRKRYSRKAWRLKKEIEAKSRDVLIKFIEGPAELRGFNYQIGDNDCEFCK